MKCNVSIFHLMDCAIGVKSKNSLPSPRETWRQDKEEVLSIFQHEGRGQLEEVARDNRKPVSQAYAMGKNVIVEGKGLPTPFQSTWDQGWRFEWKEGEN